MAASLTMAAVELGTNATDEFIAELLVGEEEFEERAVSVLVDKTVGMMVTATPIEPTRAAGILNVPPLQPGVPALSMPPRQIP